MKVLCNGDWLDIDTGAMLEEALSSYVNAQQAHALTGLAVACNGEVIPRPQWSRRPLVEGDQLDLFYAVAGG
ncbi:sulfur carrier protein ThiS [Saccharospirillum impatiens]|uniref:sulfur carrier protein ThiS n=1 Tax=Saccharospirillum impatiens TaxID=169438 RepID=UPI000404DE62|nr:sulfur carrier protein ThiS [Saccharospirillum impatiens]